MRKEEENEAKEESLSLNTNNTNIILYLACKNPLLFFAVLCSRLVVIITYSLRRQQQSPRTAPSTSQLNVPLAIDSTDVLNVSCTIVVFQMREKDCFMIDHTFLPLVTTSLALVTLHILGFSGNYRSVNWRNETNHTQTLIIPCALDPLRLIWGRGRR